MHVLLYFFNHRTSTNFTVRPASATGNQENDNDDSFNAGNVAEVCGLKTENCDGGCSWSRRWYKK